MLTQVVVEEQPQMMETPEGCLVVALEAKPFAERDFFKAFNQTLEKNKVIVFNNKTVVANPVSSLVRYVIFNSKTIILIQTLEERRM